MTNLSDIVNRERFRVSETASARIGKSITVDVHAPPRQYEQGAMLVQEMDGRRLATVTVSATHAPDETPDPRLTVDTGMAFDRESSAALAEAIAVAWKKWDERFGGQT